MFEIQEQRLLKLGDGQIAEHRSNVRFIEGINDFRISNHKIIHDRVRDQVSNQVTSGVDGITFLLSYSVSTAPELNHRCPFV